MHLGRKLHHCQLHIPCAYIWINICAVSRAGKANSQVKVPTYPPAIGRSTDWPATMGRQCYRLLYYRKFRSLCVAFMRRHKIQQRISRRDEHAVTPRPLPLALKSPFLSVSVYEGMRATWCDMAVRCDLTRPKYVYDSQRHKLPQSVTPSLSSKPLRLLVL